MPPIAASSTDGCASGNRPCANHRKKPRSYTYDHFCPFVAAPIGERNRGRFWLFLFAQTVALLEASTVAVRSESRWTRQLVGSQESTVRWEDVFARVESPLIVCIVLWLVCIGVAVDDRRLLAKQSPELRDEQTAQIFFLFHTFLAVTSITTHEFLRASTIDYLHNTEDFDLPCVSRRRASRRSSGPARSFSRGFFGNIWTYFGQDGLLATLCCRQWRPISWVRPVFIDRNSENWWEHPWQNKYWSCC